MSSVSSALISFLMHPAFCSLQASHCVLNCHFLLIGVMSMTVEIETEDLTGTDLAQIRKVDLATDVQDHDQRKEKGM